MFGSSSAFGQSSVNPFGSPSGFGQTNNQSSNPFAPKPFGSPNPFGSQTGSNIFGSTSTGVFGAAQPSSPAPAFGASSTPAFGASATPTFGSSPSFGGSSVFGQKPAFGGFGSSAQSSPFGSTPQQSQPSFGSSLFGSSAASPTFGSASTPAFGSSSTPAFGASTPAFGSNTTPAFGATSTPAFGATTTPAFGSTNTATFGNTPFGSGGGFGASSTPAFGSSSTPAFGASASPFGATSNPAFGSSPTPPFGASSTPAFGAASTPAFGSSSTPSFSFGSSFGQTASPFGSTASSSPFASQATTPAFGSSGFGQSQFGAQRGGSRTTPYSSTQDADVVAGQTPGKLASISAMPAYKEKSHEELRWEDYQLGDKGGPSPAGQATSAAGFGASSAQPNPFASSSTFGQSSSSPFSTPASSNPFGAKPSAFGSTGFGTTTSGFGSSGFGTTNTSNPFGASSAATSSLFSAPSSSPFGANTSSLFGSTSSAAFGSSPSLFGSAPAQGTTSSFASGLNFLNTSSQPFQSTTPSIGQTGGAFGQTGLSFGQASTPSFGQSSLFSTPSSFGGGNMFSSSSSLFSSSGFGQTTPALSTPFPATQSTQTSSAFNFGNFNQTQTAGVSAFGGGSSMFGQNIGQPSATQSPATVQHVTVANPFGVLPAVPQISIGQAGTSPSIQYGISSMPVVDKPAPIRVSSVLTSRHLSQRRMKLPPRKYHPKNDSQKVAFFCDDEKTPSTPKADAVFVCRDNPRALMIRPMDKSFPLKDITSVLHENGRTAPEDKEHISNGPTATDKGKAVADDEMDKEQLHSTSRASQSQFPNGYHDNQQTQKGDSYITLAGHRAGEAAIVFEHGADIEATMPKLKHSDYYTEPRIQELAAKERAEPGFCRHVRNFVVGRHGYGSIKFLGETDVRRLDLESLIQFNNREVIVYMDDTKKPPVGQGLNKPAEVTLLNIKCFNKKTGEQITEGPRVEKYKEMLRRKAEDQGAEFLSYDPVRGEWKFRVSHFSNYKLDDEGEEDEDEDSFAALC